MVTQADFVIRECEDCHEELMDSERRRRCKNCGKLVCAWCWGHIHGFVSHAQALSAPVTEAEKEGK